MPFEAAYSTSGGKTAAQSSSIVLILSLPATGIPARVHTTPTPSFCAASTSRRKSRAISSRLAGSVMFVYQARLDITTPAAANRLLISSARASVRFAKSTCPLPGPAATSSASKPFDEANSIT